MSTDLKEFTELLLNNLKDINQKVGSLQQDMSVLKSDVAVLKETKETVKKLDCCIEKFQQQMNQIDKDLALKSTKWGVISSVVTLLIALLIAFITGVFKL